MRVEVVEEGFDMTAVIAGASAAAFVMLLVIAVILHYIRGLKKKVRTSPGANNKPLASRFAS